MKLTEAVLKKIILKEIADLDLPFVNEDETVPNPQIEQCIETLTDTLIDTYVSQHSDYPGEYEHESLSDKIEQIVRSHVQEAIRQVQDFAKHHGPKEFALEEGFLGFGKKDPADKLLKDPGFRAACHSFRQSPPGELGMISRKMRIVAAQVLSDQDIAFTSDGEDGLDILVTKAYQRYVRENSI